MRSSTHAAKVTPRSAVLLVPRPQTDARALAAEAARGAQEGAAAILLAPPAPGEEATAAALRHALAGVAVTGVEVLAPRDPGDLLVTLRGLEELRVAGAARPPGERRAAVPDPWPPGPSAPPRRTFTVDELPALVRHMAVTGQLTDDCLAAGALPLPVHYYSPVPDIADLARRGVWRKRSRLAGIDFRAEAQVAYLRELGRAHGQECRWPLEPSGDALQFHQRNDSFSYGCAAVLHAMLRSRKPRRVIEIGSGHSSRVISAALAINRSEGRPADYTVIDPYPAPQIAALPSLGRLEPQRVELVSPEVFDALGEDDLLFIDSSHTVKTGGDVNFLFLDVLPALRPGVVVHVHDIALPDEYCETYFTKPSFRMFWTEAYLLQAFLACNDRFEILLSMAWLMSDHLDAFREAFPLWDEAASPARSGSFWFRRKPALVGGR